MVAIWLSVRVFGGGAPFGGFGPGSGGPFGGFGPGDGNGGPINGVDSGDNHAQHEVTQEKSSTSATATSTTIHESFSSTPSSPSHSSTTVHASSISNDSPTAAASIAASGPRRTVSAGIATGAAVAGLILVLGMVVIFRYILWRRRRREVGCPTAYNPVVVHRAREAGPRKKTFTALPTSASDAHAPRATPGDDAVSGSEIAHLRAVVVLLQDEILELRGDNGDLLPSYDALSSR